MPVDFTAREGATTPETESPTFAPTPLWERDAKKRRAARGRPAARQPIRDPAIDAGEPGAGAGVLGATTAAEPLDPAYETQRADTERRPTTRHSNGVTVGTIAAGVVVVAALGAIGWYASQRHDGGVAELTPGAPAASAVALNTAALPANPMAASTPPAPATNSASTTQENTTTTTRAAPPRRNATKPVAARAPVPRVRPADSSSALDAAVNAGATAPVIATPSPVPGGSPAPAAPQQTSPIAPPLNATPAPPPSTTAPPAGSIDDSAAPTARAPTVAPPATP